MPYRHAHWYILLLLPASALGFSSYLSDPSDSNIAVHLHAIVATLWILLLAGQSASIHAGYRVLHRRLGIAGLFLFPVYFVAFFLVFQSESRRIADGDEWAAVFGPGIGSITLIAAFATAFMFYSAMRNRRRTQLHARWMIATLFLFSESVLGRILNNHVPGLLVEKFDDIRRIYDAFHWSQALAIALAAYLYLRAPRFGVPYLFAIAALILQSIALEWFDDVQPWRDVFEHSARWPMWTLAVPGLLFGGVISALAWRFGRSPGKHGAQH